MQTLLIMWCMMVCTRPNITYVVSVVSTWILRYLKGKPHTRVVYGGARQHARDTPTEGHVDSNYILYWVFGHKISYRLCLLHMLMQSVGKSIYRR